jgi:hypothetical protein
MSYFYKNLILIENQISDRTSEKNLVSGFL